MKGDFQGGLSWSELQLILYCGVAEGSCWAAPLPECRGERVLFGPSWNVWKNFSRNFLRPLFTEIEGRKLTRNFAKFSLHFSPTSAKKFARMSPRGFTRESCISGIAKSRGDKDLKVSNNA